MQVSVDFTGFVCWVGLLYLWQATGFSLVSSYLQCSSIPSFLQSVWWGWLGLHPSPRKNSFPSHASSRCYFLGLSVTRGPLPASFAHFSPEVSRFKGSLTQLQLFSRRQSGCRIIPCTRIVQYLFCLQMYKQAGSAFGSAHIRYAETGRWAWAQGKRYLQPSTHQMAEDDGWWSSPERSKLRNRALRDLHV